MGRERERERDGEREGGRNIAKITASIWGFNKENSF